MMRFLRTSPLILLCVVLMTGLLVGQLRFSGSSRLKNAEYLEHQIKDISDEDLFGALQLNQSIAHEVKQAVQGKDFVRAYGAWASYWTAKRQPKYITQNYGLLLDTDMLKGYDDMRSFAAQHPQERDTILSRASLLQKNIIRAWGDAVIDFGSKVDFNREVGQSGKYGFHYWGWSKPLNAAYVLTGDQRYLAKFDELFHRWYKQRNTITRGFPELDVVYYELGLGTRNRMFIEYYFLPYEKRSWQTHERMLKTILGAARWLYELERWEGYRSGNWQCHGSYMLAQIALVFPEFRDSQEWLDMALQRMEEHLWQDFFEDGGHSERAPRNYTLATYLTYRNLYYLLTMYRLREDLALQIRQRMGNTIDWWVSMLAPTGEVPAINDSHRGLFPTGILQDGAEFFKKPYVYGVLRNLFGFPPKDSVLVLPSFSSRHMPASGFSVMRTDWTPDALYMNINYGKWNGPHTHNDMLDFEIYAYGRALAVDAGLGLTYDDPLYIPWYKSSQAHNMVTVNERNLARETTWGENVVWSSGALLDYFAGEHRGYASLGIYHQRQIAFVKPMYWVMLDQLKCEKGGDTLSWYFHTPTTMVSSGLGYHSSKSPGIVVLPATGWAGSRTGTCMAASTDDLTPGKTQEIRWLAFDQVAAAGSTRQFAFLLYPYRDSLPLVTLTSLSATHYRVTGSIFSDDLYYSSAPFDDGEIASDAMFLLIHREKGQSDRVSLVQGTYLRILGKEVWKSGNRTSVECSLPK